MPDPWNRRHERSSAGRDQDVLSRYALAINNHGVRVHQARTPVQNTYVRADQVVLVQSA